MEILENVLSWLQLIVITLTFIMVMWLDKRVKNLEKKDKK